MQLGLGFEIWLEVNIDKNGGRATVAGHGFSELAARTVLCDIIGAYKVEELWINPKTIGLKTQLRILILPLTSKGLHPA